MRILEWFKKWRAPKIIVRHKYDDFGCLGCSQLEFYEVAVYRQAGFSSKTLYEKYREYDYVLERMIIDFRMGNYRDWPKEREEMLSDARLIADSYRMEESCE